MKNPLARRLWPACHSALHLDRFLAGELDAGESEVVRAHVAECARCSAALEDMRPREPLPPLRLVPLQPRRWTRRLVAAAVGVAAAASVLVIARSSPDERLKGAGFSIGAYIQHGGEVRRAGPDEIVSPGDALRFTVRVRGAGYVAVLSLDPHGRASVYYPASDRAAAVGPGGEVALPLATRLDATIGEERITALFCESPVPLEPLRAALEHGRLDAPAGCQVARWNFVKR